MSAEATIDRAVGRASERVQGLFRRAIKLYGLDPSDPDYGIYRRDGSDLCRVCRSHGETTKRLPCDLEMARANEMEGLGFAAAFCRGCRQAFPEMLADDEANPNCPACRPVNSMRGYVSDGHGCVEKQHPSERYFDSRPVAGSRRAW